jgi:hypothetical protein
MTIHGKSMVIKSNDFEWSEKSISIAAIWPGKKQYWFGQRHRFHLQVLEIGRR